MLALDLFQNVESIHAGQIEIQQDQIEWLAPQQRERIRAVGGFAHLQIAAVA